MKQRRQDRVERRRPVVELNMVSEQKTLDATPRGVLAFLKRLLTGHR